MTEGSTPPPDKPAQLRIGNDERNAAMKALDAHMQAGRLGVEEYGDRYAAASGATVASELEALFTDLPEPHPVLPGTTGVSMAKPSAPPLVGSAGAVAEHGGGTVAERPSGFLEVAAPRIMAVTPFVALALFFIVGGWWWFLLIPVAGALLYGGRHERERDERRRDRRDRRGW